MYYHTVAIQQVDIVSLSWSKVTSVCACALSFQEIWMQAAGATCCGTISSPVSSQHRTTTSHTALPPAPLAPTDNYYNRLHTQPLSEYLRESQVQVFHSIPGLISVQKKTWCAENTIIACLLVIIGLTGSIVNTLSLLFTSFSFPTIWLHLPSERKIGTCPQWRVVNFNIFRYLHLRSVLNVPGI